MKGIIIATIGTPVDASRQSVSRYLVNYLGDSHVISIPKFLRRRLIFNKILPNYLSRSVERYEKLQSLYQGKMPLREFSESLEQKMRDLHPDVATYTVFLHGEDNMADRILRKMALDGPFEEVTIVPLYPQCTFSSYNSVLHSAKLALRKYLPKTPAYVVKPYFDDLSYIELYHRRIDSFLKKGSYDLMTCSFHSIPLLHQYGGIFCGFNYRTQCGITADLLAKSFDSKIRCKVSFQSAMGSGWLPPSTEESLGSLIDEGVRRILVVCPGFLIDCIETVLDIGITLREQFLAMGGEQLDLVEAPNDHPDMANFLYDLALSDKHRKRIR